MSVFGSELPPASGKPRIDVIVRTQALKERAPALLHALDGIQALACAEAHPIIVVNGERFHAPLFEALRHRSGVLLHHVPIASAGNALTEGRRLVTAPYFMYLDDDDELLEPGMGQLVQQMGIRADWDVIVTNGYGRSKGVLSPWVPDLMSHALHPALSLVGECWLSPGASVFRSMSVPVTLLETGRDHHEWTYLAFLLVLEGKRIRFLDIPTVVYNDTAGSASKSFAHREAALRLLESMRADPRTDRETRAALERKYRNTLHTLAAACLRDGARRKAWRYHLRSLRPPFTFKYLLFSRKMFLHPRRS